VGDTGPDTGGAGGEGENFAGFPIQPGGIKGAGGGGDPSPVFAKKTQPGGPASEIGWTKKKAGARCGSHKGQPEVSKMGSRKKKDSEKKGGAMFEGKRSPEDWGGKGPGTQPKNVISPIQRNGGHYGGNLGGERRIMMVLAVCPRAEEKFLGREKTCLPGGGQIYPLGGRHRAKGTKKTGVFAGGWGGARAS